MSSVNIHLDKYKICAGDTVTGRAVCCFRENKRINEIKITLRGEESTSLSGTESYYGSRDFLLKDYIVIGQGTIDAGEQAFRFEFPLPNDLPSSFQHKYGKIKFSVKLTVDRPLKSNYKVEKQFTVISPINLSTLPSSLLEPAEYSSEKTVCCCFCASGPVQLDVNLEKRAFVVDKNPILKVYCVNMSNVTVESLVAELKMKLTFTATDPGPCEIENKVVAITHSSGVGAHGERNYNVELKIPATTVVPNFIGCELFRCDFQLQITAVLAGYHSNLNIHTPVALAHVAPSPTPIAVLHQQPAPPGLVNDMPSYTTEAGTIAGVYPYPIPAYSLSPGAPQEVTAPSAPLMFSLGETSVYSGAGNSLANELPPPTYYEATKNQK